MADFVQAVQQQELLGYTGKPLRQIVNIGIGGSHLGPKVVSDALKYRWLPGFDVRYLANVDGYDFHQTCADLDPESTLFIICSKSFSTLETQLNAQAARAWLIDQLGDAKAVANHFAAVSTQVVAAAEFGIPEQRVFPLWDWVGGRYSLWSSIGLAQALVLGMPAFLELLAGAAEMDQHFKDSPLAHNLPVTLGLLDVWYINFWAAKTRAVLVYDQSLQEFPAHLQQLEMESNGKAVTHRGEPVPYTTGAIVWGGTGTNGQHAYHQLLHQGTHLIPADFIMPLTSQYPLADHHPWLFAHFLGQQQALLQGRSLAEVRTEMAAAGASEEQIEQVAPHRVMPGNRPHTSITMDAVTPRTLGALIALYEHRVFVQAQLWGINAFDQWGVELGKTLGERIYQALQDGDGTAFDAATQAHLMRFNKAQSR
jgi:glucose-6-phosphate isomerase